MIAAAINLLAQALPFAVIPNSPPGAPTFMLSGMGTIFYYGSIEEMN
jgi:hypothetical protein